jgi:hypothetical protein
MTSVAAAVAGLVMLVLATSVAGLVVAPVAVPGALYAVTRPGQPWTVRVPLLLGAAAITALVVLWLLDGASTGTTVQVG